MRRLSSLKPGNFWLQSGTVFQIIDQLPEHTLCKAVMIKTKTGDWLDMHAPARKKFDPNHEVQPCKLSPVREVD